MYCSKCGMQNSDEATQCTNCGNVLTEPSQQAVAQGIPLAAMEPKTCGLAIASLVTGILSLFCSFFMAIPAIICGIIALVKIGKSNGQLKGNGLAIAGIAVPAVLSLVVVPLMLAILMPALSKTKMIAQRVVCSTNMQGLSTAMVVYMNDSDEKYPTQDQWCDLLMQEADVSAKSFQCPLDPEGSFSYAINENLYKIAPDKIISPQMVVLFEADLGHNGVGGLDDLKVKHMDGCNVTFVDGHVEFVRTDAIPNLQWTVEE